MDRFFFSFFLLVLQRQAKKKVSLLYGFFGVFLVYLLLGSMATSKRQLEKNGRTQVEW